MYFLEINVIIRNNQTEKVGNMSVLDDIKTKLETNEKLDKEIGKAFGNIYSCTRVWSAWGHDTMSADDFAPFEKGDESFDEFVKELKTSLLTEKIDNPDKFYDLVEKHICNYELYYNEDIDRYFYSQAFKADFLGETDITDIYPVAQKYQEIHAPKAETPAPKTQKHKM